ncbi:hypothetical protein CCR85_02585 [Rhodothalassium salexigens]|nr:hypothetical protein [Rhodothalassium salexigens]
MAPTTARAAKAWMPISRPTAKPAQAGFTLFEVMLVIAIVGVMLALTVPRLNARIEAARMTEAAERVAGRIRAAPLRAQLLGQPLTFDPGQAGAGLVLVPLDDGLAGWTWAYRGALSVSALGLCEPGAVTLRGPAGRARTIRVSPPFCATEIVPGGAAR